MNKTGETITVRFGVSDPATAGLVDADALPSGVLLINAVASAATVTVADVGVGLYTASVTLPAVTDGDVLQIWITPTVGTVIGGGCVWQGEGCTIRPADLAATLAAIQGAGWTDETLVAIAAAVAALPTTGTGPHSCTWTITDGTDALEGADVTFWLAGQLKGNGTTDASGHVSMSLAAATYDVAIAADGHTFAATTYAVSAVAATWTHTFAMTTLPTPTASPAGRTTLWAYVFDQDDAPEADVLITCRMVTAAAGLGSIFDFGRRTATTNALGYVEFTKCVQGAVYQVARGKVLQEVTVGTAATQGVGNFGGCDG